MFAFAPAPPACTCCWHLQLSTGASNPRNQHTQVFPKSRTQNCLHFCQLPVVDNLKICRLLKCIYLLWQLYPVCIPWVLSLPVQWRFYGSVHTHLGLRPPPCSLEMLSAWSGSTSSLNRWLTEELIHLQINAVTNLSQIGTISHYLKFRITSETNLEIIQEIYINKFAPKSQTKKYFTLWKRRHVKSTIYQCLKAK